MSRKSCKPVDTGENDKDNKLSARLRSETGALLYPPLDPSQEETDIRVVHS